jgi:hypothetical protein
MSISTRLRALFTRDELRLILDEESYRRIATNADNRDDIHLRELLEDDLKLVDCIEIAREVECFFDAPGAPPPPPSSLGLTQAYERTLYGPYMPVPASLALPAAQNVVKVDSSERPRHLLAMAGSSSRAASVKKLTAKSDAVDNHAIRKVLIPALRALEQKAKEIAVDTSSEVRDAAVRLTQMFSASGQLGGWQHVEEFMDDQALYQRRTRCVERGNSRAVRSGPATGAGAKTGFTYATAAPSAAASAAASAASANAVTVHLSDDRKHLASMAKASAKKAVPVKTIVATAKDDKVAGKIEILQNKADAHLRHTLTRAALAIALENRYQSKGDMIANRSERILALLQCDRKWMSDGATFLKNAEQQVSGLVNMDPSLFAKFRDLQSRGVQWPHSPQLRRHIERAGFIYRPMMIKRDRCVCDACGVEISGWRPWYNPWLFHDWSKRHPFLPPPEVRNSFSSAAPDTPAPDAPAPGAPAPGAAAAAALRAAAVPSAAVSHTAAPRATATPGAAVSHAAAAPGAVASHAALASLPPAFYEPEHFRSLSHLALELGSDPNADPAIIDLEDPFRFTNRIPRRETLARLNNRYSKNPYSLTIKTDHLEYYGETEVGAIFDECRPASIIVEHDAKTVPGYRAWGSNMVPFFNHISKAQEKQLDDAKPPVKIILRDALLPANEASMLVQTFNAAQCDIQEVDWSGNPELENLDWNDSATLAFHVMLCAKLYHFQNCGALLNERKQGEKMQPRHLLKQAVDIQNGLLGSLFTIFRNPEPEVNQQDDDGNTPLHQAVKEGNTIKVFRLLMQGADPGIRNAENRTAADLAPTDSNLINNPRAIIQQFTNYRMLDQLKEISLDGNYLLIRVKDQEVSEDFCSALFRLLRDAALLAHVGVGVAEELRQHCRKGLAIGFSGYLRLPLRGAPAVSIYEHVVAAFAIAYAGTNASFQHTQTPDPTQYYSSEALFRRIDDCFEVEDDWRLAYSTRERPDTEGRVTAIIQEALNAIRDKHRIRRGQRIPSHLLKGINKKGPDGREIPLLSVIAHKLTKSCGGIVLNLITQEGFDPSDAVSSDGRSLLTLLVQSLAEIMDYIDPRSEAKVEERGRYKDAGPIIQLIEYLIDPANDGADPGRARRLVNQTSSYNYRYQTQDLKEQQVTLVTPPGITDLEKDINRIADLYDPALDYWHNCFQREGNMIEWACRNGVIDLSSDLNSPLNKLIIEEIQQIASLTNRAQRRACMKEWLAAVHKIKRQQGPDATCIVRLSKHRNYPLLMLIQALKDSMPNSSSSAWLREAETRIMNIVTRHNLLDMSVQQHPVTGDTPLHRQATRTPARSAFVFVSANREYGRFPGFFYCYRMLPYVDSEYFAEQKLDETYFTALSKGGYGRDVTETGHGWTKDHDRRDDKSNQGFDNVVRAQQEGARWAAASKRNTDPHWRGITRDHELSEQYRKTHNIQFPGIAPPHELAHMDKLKGVEAVLVFSAAKNRDGKTAADLVKEEITVLEEKEKQLEGALYKKNLKAAGNGIERNLFVKDELIGRLRNAFAVLTGRVKFNAPMHELFINSLFNHAELQAELAAQERRLQHGLIRQAHHNAKKDAELYKKDVAMCGVLVNYLSVLPDGAQHVVYLQKRIDDLNQANRRVEEMQIDSQEENRPPLKSETNKGLNRDINQTRDLLNKAGLIIQALAEATECHRDLAAGAPEMKAFTNLNQLLRQVNQQEQQLMVHPDLQPQTRAAALASADVDSSDPEVLRVVTERKTTADDLLDPEILGAIRADRAAKKCVDQPQVFEAVQKRPYSSDPSLRKAAWKEDLSRVRNDLKSARETLRKIEEAEPAARQSVVRLPYQEKSMAKDKVSARVCERTMAIHQTIDEDVQSRGDTLSPDVTDLIVGLAGGRVVHSANCSVTEMPVVDGDNLAKSLKEKLQQSRAAKEAREKEHQTLKTEEKYPICFIRKIVPVAELTTDGMEVKLKSELTTDDMDAKSELTTSGMDAKSELTTSGMDAKSELTTNDMDAKSELTTNDMDAKSENTMFRALSRQLPDPTQARNGSKSNDSVSASVLARTGGVVGFAAAASAPSAAAAVGWSAPRRR